MAQLTLAGADRKWSGRFLDNVTVDDVSENLVWLDNSLGCGLSRAGLVSICWGLGGPWCNGDWSLEDWSRGDHGARSTEVWRSEVGHGRIDLLGQHGWTGVTEQGLGLDGSDSGDSGEGGGHLVDWRLHWDTGHGDNHGLRCGHDAAGGT